MTRWDWRLIKGKWHYTEHFTDELPEATQMETFCQIFKPYGLFDRISKEMPIYENICETCKAEYLRKQTSQEVIP